jgi:hypothetical protein
MQLTSFKPNRSSPRAFKRTTLTLLLSLAGVTFGFAAAPPAQTAPAPNLWLIFPHRSLVIERDDQS